MSFTKQVSCSTCGSKGSNKSTCPLNPDCVNPVPKKHRKVSFAQKNQLFEVPKYDRTPLTHNRERYLGCATCPVGMMYQSDCTGNRKTSLWYPCRKISEIGAQGLKKCYDCEGDNYIYKMM